MSNNNDHNQDLNKNYVEEFFDTYPLNKRILAEDFGIPESTLKSWIKNGFPSNADARDFEEMIYDLARWINDGMTIARLKRLGGISITWLVGQIGITKTTFYRWLKNDNLSKEKIKLINEPLDVLCEAYANFKIPPSCITQKKENSKHLKLAK